MNIKAITKWLTEPDAYNYPFPHKIGERLRSPAKNLEGTVRNAKYADPVRWLNQLGELMQKTSSNNLVGVAGEYYVCAELCRRGHLALLTPKNNPLFDVIASTPDGSNTVSIQVKTRSIRNTQGWKLGKDITIKKGNPNLFIVLVNLEESGLPEFYVYEYDHLADVVQQNYATYLEQPKRDGSKRKDVGFRWHDAKLFTDDDRSRKGNWEPIERILAQDRCA